MTDTATTSASPTPGYEGWAVVELMGHRRRAGLVRETEMFGTKLLRIDIPQIPPRPAPPVLEWRNTGNLEDGEESAEAGEHLFKVARGDAGRIVAEHHCGGERRWTGRTCYGWSSAKQQCEERHVALMRAAEPEVPLISLPMTTEFYGGPAIYSLRPCSEAVARTMIERIGDPRPVAPVDYRAAEANGQRTLTYSSALDE